jgi:hypothetical protein
MKQTTRQSLKKLSVSLVVALVSVLALAQRDVTITDGAASFTIKNYSGTQNRELPFECDFIVGGVDHMRSLPWYAGAGDARNQKPLYKLTRTEPAGAPTNWVRFYYNQSYFDSAHNYNFRTLLVVTYKITDLSVALFGLNIASAKLETQFVWIPQNGSGLRVRAYAVNDPTLNGSIDGMAADNLNGDVTQQLIAAPPQNGRMAFMSWQTTRNAIDVFRWEVNDWVDLESKLRDNSVALLRNGVVPYGPGPYGGAFQYGKVLRNDDWLAQLTTHVVTMIPFPG